MDKNKIIKGVLKKDYVNVFLDGFKLKNIDNNINEVNKEEKVEIMKNAVLDALDVDLRLHSSPSRNKKIKKIRFSV